MLPSGKRREDVKILLLVLPVRKCESVVMLCCIPFAKKEIQGAKQEGEEEQEQQVKPLRTKKMSVAFGAIIVGDIAYCAVVNGIIPIWYLRDFPP